MDKNKQVKEYQGQNGIVKKYDAAFKSMVARQYMDSGLSIRHVSQMFNVSISSVSCWAHEFYPELSATNATMPMTEQEQNDVAVLKKEIDALKKKLELEQMRNFAWETMDGLAKTELGIDIRKNFGAKQPKE